MYRFPAAAIALALIALTSDCGGGGSAGGPPAVPPAPGTPAGPGTVPVVNPPTGGGSSTPTSFAVVSFPSGLPVTVTNNNVAQTVSPPTTPTTVRPAPSNFAATISIVPNNSAPPFVFLADQRGNGSHTVLYNQAADTNGSIGSVSATSAGRRAADAVTIASSALPRFFSHGAFARPHESSSRLVVRYRASALGIGTGSANQLSILRGGQQISRTATANQLERSEGVARAVDIGAVTNDIATRVLEVPASQSIGTLAARMSAHSEVLSAKPERLYYKESRSALSTSDPHFDPTEQWSLFAIGAPNAWGYTLGNPGIAIAMIDTGADFGHQDLAGGKIVYAESVLNGVVTVGNGAAQDTDGHGTNTAGIAAADTNNGLGVAGVGYNTSLQIYKVFSNGTAANQFSPSANSGDVTQAIYDAVAHGAKVINMSLGSCQSEGLDPMQRDAVTFALAHNVVVVAASGNERGGGGGDPNCASGSSTVDFPAAYDGVIAVGASALNDSASPGRPSPLNVERVASYSNAGPGLSLVAPGGDPTKADLTASPADLLHWIEGLYTNTPADTTMQCKTAPDCRALFAGTSQATPHVSGAAALVLAANPNLTPAQVKRTLMSTADDIHDPFEGAGRLNAYRALAAASGDTMPPALPTALNFVAFAYVPNGTNVPMILDVTYTSGVPVASDGTFRIADIQPGPTAYKIGVWSDANGDGKIDLGDSFGTTPSTCTAAASCGGAAGIITHPVSAGFVLN